MDFQSLATFSVIFQKRKAEEQLTSADVSMRASGLSSTESSAPVEIGHGHLLHALEGGERSPGGRRNGPYGHRSELRRPWPRRPAVALSAGGGLEGAGDGEEAREGGELTRSTQSSTARDEVAGRRGGGARTAAAIVTLPGRFLAWGGSARRGGDGGVIGLLRDGLARRRP